METKYVEYRFICTLHGEEHGHIIRALADMHQQVKGKPIRSLPFPDEFSFRYSFIVVNRPVIAESNLEPVLSGKLPLELAALDYINNMNYYRRITAQLANVENLMITVRIKGGSRVIFSQKVLSDYSKTANRPKSLIDFIQAADDKSYPSKKITITNLSPNRSNEFTVIRTPTTTYPAYIGEGYVKTLPYHLAKMGVTPAPSYERFADLDY